MFICLHLSKIHVSVCVCVSINTTDTITIFTYTYMYYTCTHYHKKNHDKVMINSSYISRKKLNGWEWHRKSHW